MADRRGRTTGWLAAAALLLAGAMAPGAATAAQPQAFANGITATIHPAAEVTAGLLVERGGRLFLEHPAAGTVELETDARTWHPFDAATVAAALAGMTGFVTDVDVEVFVLPAPPRATGSSYARGGTVFLAPGTGPVPAETVAYIAVHEVGHVLTWAFIDGQPGRWDAYLALRGLDGTASGPDAPHADRAREILAEDLRFLFGGRLATRSGSIENHDLVLPDQVPGLRDLLSGYLAGRAPAGLVASSVWPNPCNPLTTIAMELPAEARAEGGAELRIYDLRGALVRSLRGGTATGGRIALQWHGDDHTGGAAASGRYLYVMTAAGLTARGAVTLVR
ncbi:MAG: FlgD immunoglobulin-like domain containing protein [Candidatus Krumholzibacteriia bacterium]